MPGLLRLATEAAAQSAAGKTLWRPAMLGASVEGTVKGLGSRVVGGSWVVISGVASPSVRIITIVILLKTLNPKTKT